MDFATIIGVVSGLGLVLSAILLKASITNFVDVAGIFIVFGGTTAAILNSFPLASVLNAFKSSVKIFFAYQINYVAILREMLILSRLARKDGPLALEKHKTADHFLKKGLALVADGTKGKVLREILILERDALEERHAETQIILEKMGELAPAWGMVGTLIGLVIMLLNLSDPSTIGPAMAVALLTTFYGALWANFILLPAATKLEQRTKKEMLKNTLIIETLISIAENENVRILQERLLGALPPRDRQAAISGAMAKTRSPQKRGAAAASRPAISKSAGK